MIKTTFVAALLTVALGGPVAAATAHLHGVVLGVTPATGEAVVRHDPLLGMPSMTMPFRVMPPGRARELQAGTTIDATVDTSTDPWTLRDLHVATTQPVTAPAATAPVAPLAVGDVVPEVPFVDQAGRPFRFSQLRGRDVVLAFIYTRCQDPRMCPLISAKFGALQRKRGARDLRLVEVSLDPSYDRPPILARYAAAYGADPAVWTLAVGDAAPTLAFAARFGIVAIPDPNIGIIHSENTVEIAPDGRIANMFADASWQPEEILADIDARRHLAANPIARLDRRLALVVATVLASVYLLSRLARGIFAKNA